MIIFCLKFLLSPLACVRETHDEPARRRCCFSPTAEKKNALFVPTDTMEPAPASVLCELRGTEKSKQRRKKAHLPPKWNGKRCDDDIGVWEGGEPTTMNSSHFTIYFSSPFRWMDGCLVSCRHWSTYIGYDRVSLALALSSLLHGSHKTLWKFTYVGRERLHILHITIIIVLCWKIIG